MGGHRSDELTLVVGPTLVLVEVVGLENHGRWSLQFQCRIGWADEPTEMSTSALHPVGRDGPGDEPREVASGRGHDDASIGEAVAAQTGRIYWKNRWVAPLGTFATATVLSSTLREALPERRLLLWFLVVVVIVVGVAVSVTFPRFASRRNASGFPIATQPAHFAIGAAFGALMWLAPEVTTDDVAMWTVLAGLFAMSAGVAGMSGLNRLSLLVLCPMWLLAGVALLVNGTWIPGAGVVVFLVIVLGDQWRSTTLWRELLELRLRDSRQAEDNAWRANRDGLTGLLNRSGLAEQMEASRRAATAMFIDLDHFKAANDRFGHGAGDVVLEQVARRLEAAVRNTDTLARIGGDEFFVVFDRQLTDEQAVSTGQNIIAALEDPFVSDVGEEILISASVGYSTLPAGEVDPSRLMMEADHAMLHAKRRGRRQVAAFTNSLAAQVDARSGLESALRKAVRSGAIGCAAQPVFNLATGEVISVELLARWQLPEGALVSPAVFIPLAEEVGLIDELTGQMLDQAGRLLGAWAREPLLKTAQISLNISPVQVAKGKLLEIATEAIERHNIGPGRLTFELRESATLSDMASTVNLFEALRRLGVALIIDDFGSGYSSLGHLMSLPLSGVKIDRSLIAGLGADARHRAVMVAVCELATVLGHEILAEGIESQRQIEMLVGIGVGSGQGDHLLRPVPPDQLPEHLAALDWRRPEAVDEVSSRPSEPVSIR